MSDIEIEYIKFYVYDDIAILLIVYNMMATIMEFL